MLTVVLLRAEGRKTNASREVPSGACTWRRQLRMDAGVRRRREKREPEGRRGPTAHLSVHLDGLLLQGSAPSPPERLLVRPPGRSARPQPQFERVAPHHEEATVLGPRRAAPGNNGYNNKNNKIIIIPFLSKSIHFALACKVVLGPARC